MDGSDVENAEKLSEDLVRGENDLGNGKLGGEHEKLDEMDVDDENECKEVSVKDQSEVENGADDQSHSAGNGPSEICEEVMAPEKNASEDEQGTGRGSLEEEKSPGRDLVEEDKGTGNDSVKEEKCAGRDSMKEEKGTGNDSVELNITAADSVEEEKDTGKDSLEEENGTGKVSVEEEKDNGKDSVEEENGTGKLSVEVEKGTGKDFVEEEKGIGKDSVEEEDGIGRESVEEKSTGKESMEEKATGKESVEEKVTGKKYVEEEKDTSKESVEEEKITGKESVEEEKVTKKESVEEVKVTFNESLEEKVTGKESVEEKVIDRGCVEEEKRYFSEFPTNGEAEENKIEKGGIMVAETNVKTAVTSVVNDGKRGHSEVLANKDEDDCVAMYENNEAASDSNYRPENTNDANGGTEMRQSDDNCLAADQAESITPYGVGKYNGEKLKENGDTNEAPVFQLTEEEETGTPEEQANFFTELEKFYKGRSIDFKAPKFYGQILNCLKLYRAVTRLGGYDRVTGLKLWRQIGESFHPPKTCTTVSWTFRIFYEKALLEYERHKLQNGELQLAIPAVPEPIRIENENPGSGRQRRDAAARAMQGWHAQRHNGYGEVGEPIIKEKNVNNMPKREKYLKSIGSLKHKRQGEVEYPMKAARTETSKQLVATVVDVGPPADWVKINIRESKDCFEVYALVPGLLREEVRVQSDPAGRLVITGQPEQHENPWGITSFKKVGLVCAPIGIYDHHYGCLEQLHFWAISFDVVANISKVISLPGRIDPLQTSAVVSLHGRLFVRVPFEKSSV